MNRVFLIVSAVALAGCESEHFAHPLTGEPFCERSWNGTWTPSDELVRELDDPGVTRIELRLEQPPDCRGATLVAEGCEADDGEAEECYTLTWNIEFVRLNERTFASLLLTSIDAEPASDRDFEFVEILDVTESGAEVLLVNSERLTELIDAGRLTGTYEDERHGPIIHITSTEEELSSVVVSEPDVFGKVALRFNRRN